MEYLKELEYGIRKDRGSGREIFLISSGKVIATDPCYDKDIWCNKILDDVAKGWWCAYVTQAKLGKLGYRSCEIEIELVERYPPLVYKEGDIVLHEDSVIRNIQNSDEWESIDCKIGVDSGQAGFFDVDHFKDENVVTEEIKKEIKQLEFIESNDQWYGMSCVKTLSTAGWGVIPFGAVTSSGYGDGCYSLYVKRFLKEIVAMKIIFIPVKIVELGEE